MREIKFRIWHLGLKRFVAGYEDKNSYEELYSDPAGLFFGALNQLKDNKDCTLQQFTGLKDKNGKEIYEGDIVNTIYPNDPPLNIGDVIFYKETCAFRIKTIKQLLPIVTLRFVDDKPQGLLQVADEVVGNIFENPELCAK